MVWCEAIIAAQINVNAETDTLNAIAGTSLTTRTGYGRPKITHACAFVDTDDIQRVWVVPSGYNDPNGFEIEMIGRYSAVHDFKLEESRLPIPVEVPENCALTISATSETAANTAIQVWMMLEYPKASVFVDPKKSGGLVKRAWEHGAALVSNTVANSTNITDLQAGRQYQLIGVGKAAVNGATAGIVGPAFFGLQPNHTDGANWYIPLCNASNYVVGNGEGWVDFADCGIKAPVIAGGQPLLTRAVGFTAEQPQAELQFAVDKVFA